MQFHPLNSKIDATKNRGSSMQNKHFLGMFHVTGSDAANFLQGQLTCDVKKIIASPYVLWGAHCNPQGRIIFNFILAREDPDNYLFFLPRTMIPIAINALKKYAIFSKVAIEDISEKLCKYSEFLPHESHNDRLRYGGVFIYPDTSEKFLPHELNYQWTDAISFQKGCYVGQEIITRMEHRGQIKKHLYYCELKGAFKIKRNEKLYDHLKKPISEVVEHFLHEEKTYIALVLSEQYEHTEQFFTNAGESMPVVKIILARSET